MVKYWRPSMIESTTAKHISIINLHVKQLLYILPLTSYANLRRAMQSTHRSVCEMVYFTVQESSASLCSDDFLSVSLIEGWLLEVLVPVETGTALRKSLAGMEASYGANENISWEKEGTVLQLWWYFRWHVLQGLVTYIVFCFSSKIH